MFTSLSVDRNAILAGLTFDVPVVLCEIDERSPADISKLAYSDASTEGSFRLLLNFLRFLFLSSEPSLAMHV